MRLTDEWLRASQAIGGVLRYEIVWNDSTLESLSFAWNDSTIGSLSFACEIVGKGHPPTEVKGKPAMD